ncbi:hypothetical protein [Actinomycetospora straminea]|uniref:Uncharacterized protein n=1 Tax=Actinomycetospora straminea TaxID=663607 RepID=A0ABP9E3F2_9PSEU|nr:hypothetical protein [Actinomycetospora straminea]MDD7934577.1 hypothetical protein [Actinomycetospora straminea]
MDPAQDPWVPAPRDGDREEDWWSVPTVPFPRLAPPVEQLSDPFAASVERPAAVAEPVPAPSTALVVRDEVAPGALRSIARAAARAWHVAVDGVRAAIAAIAAAPAHR